MTSDTPSIPPEAYDSAYYLEECEGHEIFGQAGGRELPERLKVALALTGDLAGRRVLDLGCGRGEMVRYLRDRGVAIVGIEYARAALELARPTVGSAEAVLLQANAKQLPFAEAAFDVVLALDFVEHLYPAELDQALREVYRVLAPGGRLIVHTMPNLWYYRFGYPWFRLVQRVRGVRLPRNPRERWRCLNHVNEQSVLSLRRSLHRAGLRGTVRLQNVQDFGREESPTLRRIYRLLSTVYPFAWVFCSDLFAVGYKETAAR